MISIINMITVNIVRRALDSVFKHYIIHTEYDYPGRKTKNQTCFAIELPKSTSAEWDLAHTLGGLNDIDRWFDSCPKKETKGNNTVYYWPKIEIRP